MKLMKAMKKSRTQIARINTDGRHKNRCRGEA